MARKGDARARSSTPRLPSEVELAIARNYEARTNKAIPRRTGPTRPMNIGLDEMLAAASLMNTDNIRSPLAGLGGLTRAAAAEARQFSSDDSGGWDEYYSDTQSGYDYQNLASQPMTGGTTYDQLQEYFTNQGYTIPNSREPAPISVRPTASKNPDRPRTVAAGYDAQRMVLTIVFRDGTFYNYYQVSPDEWRDFVQQPSKGGENGPIRRFLDGKPRGTANMSGTSLLSRESLYRISRTAQWVYGGALGGQFDFG